MTVTVSFDLEDRDASAIERLVESSGMSLSELLASLAKEQAAEYEDLLAKVEVARASVEQGDIYTLEQVEAHCSVRRKRMCAPAA